MNVSLTPYLESLVQQYVASGRYTSASEVIREALRVLEQRDAQIVRVRALIEEGLAAPAEPWEGAEAIIRQARAAKAQD
ncbi:MAG: type II toxin-antitoxin system ParD family antitoxin [Oscillochloris sp.]|nr:type II toxin-antitoxin system ParD family antitoxin [Oscillochloris sp.]